MKRSISMLLSMLILFSTLITPLSAISASAEGGRTTSTPLVSEPAVEYASEGLDFTLNDDGRSYSVTGIGDCTDTDLIIPSTYNGFPVTGIGRDAFWYCTVLTSVIIPDSVTSIEGFAFSNCSALTSVTIPDSVTSIGRNAFAASGLTSVTIPDSVTSLGYSAFSNCESLTSATLGSGVTIIDASLFSECTALTSVTIPDGVTSIGSYAFYLCSSLESITIPDGVTSIGSAAFQYCRDLTSVNIPDNVTRMGDYAFAYCTGLTSIAIPDSVTIMENNAFFDCTNLTDIYCEAESQPSGWYSEWLNYCDAVVHWGVDFVDSDTEPVATDAPETESSDTTEETTDETTVPETESTESSSPIRDFEEVEMPTDEEKLWSTSFNYYLGVNQLTNPVGSWSWANTFEGKDGCWGVHNDAVFLDGDLKTIFWKIEDNDYLNNGVTAVKEIVFADRYNQVEYLQKPELIFILFAIVLSVLLLIKSKKLISLFI
ncbi:MAG: leucine-rich repeat domain-containing protein, partial [Clostridia bacterium]|nr:leucine-rich repeat domain-containing protein [Clostridia bacterium]